MDAVHVVASEEGAASASTPATPRPVPYALPVPAALPAPSYEGRFVVGGYLDAYSDGRLSAAGASDDLGGGVTGALAVDIAPYEPWGASFGTRFFSGGTRAVLVEAALARTVSQTENATGARQGALTGIDPRSSFRLLLGPSLYLFPRFDTEGRSDKPRYAVEAGFDYRSDTVDRATDASTGGWRARVVALGAFVHPEESGLRLAVGRTFAPLVRRPDGTAAALYAEATGDVAGKLVWVGVNVGVALGR